ncbi:MAG TPA: N-acetyltransferase [Saprospiraceae bacterium]|jgi:ribosomal protein S18 acetylase RimI-like enzyme|nr:N-acetyltransferase [Saprospiraceae bacterium]
MEKKITYRKVEETDAGLIVSIDESRYPQEQALTISFVKSCLRLHNKTIFVATVDENKLIGFCIGLSSKSEETGWIYAVTVSKDFEGQGIGKTLLENVFEKLKDFGCLSVSLTAIPNLVAYYEKLGFLTIGEELKNFYGKGEHRFILKKTL